MADKNEKTNQTCVTSLKLLGDFYTLRIIDALKTSSHRYCEIQRALGNVNPVTLTNRLQKLEKARLISREHDANDKIAVLYSLTSLGKSSLPVIEAVNNFSKQLL